MDRNEENETTAIKLKQCPKCKTPIRKCMRYGNMVKKALTDVERVKRKGLGEPAKIDELKQRLFSCLTDEQLLLVNAFLNINEVGNDDDVPKNTHHDKESIYGQVIIDSIKRIQDIDIEKLQQHELYSLTNRVSFLKKIAKLEENWKEFPLNSLASKEEMKLMSEDTKFLKNFLKKHHSLRQKISDQQVDDVQGEIERISFWHTLLHLKERFNLNGDASYDRKIRALLQNVTTGFRIKQNEMTSIKEEINFLEEKAPGIGISQDEKAQIIKAIGLSARHWYKCPKGKY
jgi:hypothetical protein